jgi:hypothetical protein
MELTLAGMVMLVRLVQPLNAELLIDVTLAGMVTVLVIPLGGALYNVVFPLLYNIPPSLE